VIPILDKSRQWDIKVTCPTLCGTPTTAGIIRFFRAALFLHKATHRRLFVRGEQTHTNGFGKSAAGREERQVIPLSLERSKYKSKSAEQSECYPVLVRPHALPIQGIREIVLMSIR
jgi:hypothetical protein